MQTAAEWLADRGFREGGTGDAHGGRVGPQPAVSATSSTVSIARLGVSAVRETVANTL
jgi:hypothetical protein